MIQFQTSPLKYRSYIEVSLFASGWPEKVIYMGQLFHTGPEKGCIALVGTLYVPGQLYFPLRERKKNDPGH